MFTFGLDLFWTGRKIKCFFDIFIYIVLYCSVLVGCSGLKLYIDLQPVGRERAPALYF